MRVETRIIVPSRYNPKSRHDTLLKTLDILYNVVIDQEIKLMCDGEWFLTKVIGMSDIVYEDVIYRYVEVVVINCDF